MEESLSLNEIKKRAISAFLLLTSRQIFFRAITPINNNLILAPLLGPAITGTFNIATAVVTFFTFFSDIGLAASIIQKKDQVTANDIKSTFTVQQILVGSLSLLVIFAAPLISNFYEIGEPGTWLIRALGLSFFLTSLKVLPSVMLERNLNFKPLVFVEMAETIIFNGLLFYLAISGFQIWSFTIAVVVRSLMGVIIIYILAPVRVGIGIDSQALKGLLKFGLPFQTNNLLALLKDRLVPLVVAKMVGPTGVGYVTWSQSMAFLPLEFMNSVIRITFPAFSRLQDDKENLTKAVEKSLFVTTLVVYPALFGLAAIMPSLVTHVMNTNWQPAIFSFYLFAFSTFWAVISTTFTNTLNAIGKINTSLKLMIMWTILTWILTPPLVRSYGFEGVGLASFLISFSSVITIMLVKRVLDVQVIRAIYLPLLSSILMALCVYLFSLYFVRDKLTLIPAVLLGGMLYLAFIYIFSKGKILVELQKIRELRNA